jgi:hypothetical protein
MFPDLTYRTEHLVRQRIPPTAVGGLFTHSREMAHQSQVRYELSIDCGRWFLKMGASLTILK